VGHSQRSGESRGAPPDGRGDLAVRVYAEAMVAAGEVCGGAALEHACAPQVALRQPRVGEAGELLRGGGGGRLLIPARSNELLMAHMMSHAGAINAPAQRWLAGRGHNANQLSAPACLATGAEILRHGAEKTALVLLICNKMR
jgi:hypothetical protein